MNRNAVNFPHERAVQQSKLALACALFACVALFGGFGLAGASEGADLTKRAITHDDYDSWIRIQGPQISPDGQWVLYRAVPGEGDGELVVRSLDSDREFRHSIGYAPPRRPTPNPGGAPPSRSPVAGFSPDSRFVVFMINPSYEAAKKADKKGKGKKADKPTKSLGILRLSDGHVDTLERVKNFKLPKEAGAWVAYLKEAEKKDKAKGKKEKSEGSESKSASASKEGSSDGKKDKKKTFGTQLALRNLDDGGEKSFESVTSYRLTKKSDWLLYVVSSKEKPKSDGVYAHAPGKSDTRTLMAGEGNYKRWAMDKEETRLAFLSDRDSYDADAPHFKLFGWKAGEEQGKLWVSHDTISGFPQGMAVSDKSSVSFSDDGSIVMFGIKQIPQPEKDEDEGEEKEERAKFDLWHWDDPYPQPQQLRLANRYKNQTWESVYHLNERRFVQLADEDVPDVRLSDDGSMAFARNNKPYRQLIAFDGSYFDLYAVDPKNGSRRIVAERVPRSGSLSPGGKYVFWFDEEGDWHIHDIAAEKTRNVTASVDDEIRFEREDWDTPSTPAAYGIAGWTQDDASVLIYDRFDIWEFRPDGSGARRITEGFGRENSISLRYRRLDPDEDFIDPAKPMLLSATNADTIASGFYRDQVSGNRPPQKLMMDDKGFGSVQKAKNADRLVFTRMAFDEYPDIWTSGLDFDAPKKVSKLGTQMDSFLWGKSELRDFYSADGLPLKGILIKPEGFDPSKKYPLMVYIYETLHNNLHRFRAPGPGTSINPSYYASNGYVIWMPDIEYGTGYPGRDALKCVLPGVQMLVQEGYIDRDAIGIQGHSWGGYQIAYMVTQTDIFAAAEAGAPVSNMVSAYGGIRWSSGMVRQFQYERTQSRLGKSLWDVPMRYLENSPIFWADKINTPLLILHNDEDGAVPWYQGIELIMALRRLEREAYMFNYNGEAHGLRQRVNQKDWTRRMAEFFDHHLKGAPAPDWMSEGIPGWEKETSDR